MSRAYQIHLAQIEAHEASYPTSLATEALQITHPDLSCSICFPPTIYHRQFRTFWTEYQSAYFANRYTQQTIVAYFELRQLRIDYNTARAAARDIVFSCRYSNPNLNPREVISALLCRYTRFTLLPTLPQIFE